MNDLIDKLIPALIQVESGGNPDKLGDYNVKKGNYDAVGILQIHPCVIDEINQWVADRKDLACFMIYTDRQSPQLSKAICRRYLSHWGRHYEKRGKSITLEVLARIWNGGPNGWKKKSTEKYWLKVKVELKKQEK